MPVPKSPMYARLAVLAGSALAALSLQACLSANDEPANGAGQDRPTSALATSVASQANDRYMSVSWTQRGQALDGKQGNSAVLIAFGAGNKAWMYGKSATHNRAIFQWNGSDWAIVNTDDPKPDLARALAG